MNVARLLLVLLLQLSWLSAEPVAVRLMEGSVHGFLVLRSTEGKVLASGDLVQVALGDRVTSRLVFHFKDGSIDEESSLFTQHQHFRLVSDHLVQKGPAFPQPIDLSIKVPAGEVTVRVNENGKEKVQTEHMKIDPDIANGIILDLLKSIPPGSNEMKVSYVAPTPKPRMVKLLITPHGKDRFSVAGLHEEAVRYAVKVEIGGLAGLLALFWASSPLILMSGLPAVTLRPSSARTGRCIWVRH